MAARTPTIHNLPSDGMYVARGIVAVADGDTFNTGLPVADACILTAQTADVVATPSAYARGVVTVRVFSAGVASAGTQTCYWKAWMGPARVDTS